MPKSLRQWLFIGLSALACVPLALVAAILLSTLLPRIHAQLDTENRALGNTLSTQIEGVLLDYAKESAQLGEHILTLPGTPAQLHPRLLLVADTFASTEPFIDAFYILDPQYRVTQVGLSLRQRTLRDNYLAQDFSDRAFIQAARTSLHPTWSDTYLAPSGKTVIALAVPIRERTLLAEIDIAVFSAIAQRLSDLNNALVIIVNHKGQAITQPGSMRLPRQENWIDNPLFKAGLAGKTASGRFTLHGIEYLGFATGIRDLGWVTITAKPTASAFASFHSIRLLLLCGIGASFVLAILAAYVASYRLSAQVKDFSDHLHAVASGDYAQAMPRYHTQEISLLAENIQRMAAAVLDRESWLRHSEAQYRGVVESTEDLIIRVDIEGRFTFVNHMAIRYFGLAAAECIGLSAFDFVHPEDRQATRLAFREWLLTQDSSLHFENRMQSRNGNVHLMQWRIVPDRDELGEVIGFSSIARDITEQHRVEDQLRLAASVFESSAEGIIITDAERRIISANPTITEFTGYTPAELIGRKPSMFSSGKHKPAFYRDIWDALDSKGCWRGEIWNRRKNGEEFPLWLTITVIRDKDGKPSHFIGSCFDISERKRAEEHIQFLAHHDVLTGLPNRTLLNDRLQQALAKAHRNHGHSAILFLDLDRFKLINDTLGHDTGDKLLAMVGSKLRELLRETETVARLGGDEFVIIVPETESAKQVSVVAQKVLETIGAPHVIDGRNLHVTPSIGISIFPDDGADAVTLLRNADTAMYYAKSLGRNNYQFFTQAMNDAVIERAAIENDLRSALEHNEFRLYYQSQIDSRSGVITGVEALIRWQHPERGLLAPCNFIAIAEETGLIIPIGAWVLNEACRQAKTWHDTGYAGLRVSVNLSACQFQHDGLYDQIANALKTSGIDHAALEIELKEGMLILDPNRATDLLHALADLGVKLAIDDFGTGFSNLGYLRQLPVSRLKIDRSFIHDLTTHKDDAAIVSAIIASAQNLHIDVIAEGVETPEQMRFLEQHGCFEMQGNLFAQPRPAEALVLSQFRPL